jgi:hypothetical protein
MSRLKNSLKFAATLSAVGAVIAARVVASAAANTQQGCMDQWLFDSVWRVEVTKVEPYMNGGQQSGWQVTEVWRNGYNQEAAPNDSDLLDQKLTLQNGFMLASGTTTASLSMNAVAYHDFAPSAQFTYVQIFLAPTVDPSNKPKALDITFDGAKLAALKAAGARGFHAWFTTSKYDFHFDLTCTATGAAAQAQGGSTEIAAVPGCMNQWVANGIWRVRATAIGPDNNGDPTSPQIGWMVTEEWTNLTHQPLEPSDTLDTDQHLIMASGNDVASSNTTGTSLNQQQLDFHTIAPGTTFTYQQRFRWANFSADDKPVKMLFTFDAATEAKNPNRPHYTSPADFRIDLTCSK